MNFVKFYPQKTKKISFNSKYINLGKSVFEDFEDEEKVDIWVDKNENAIKIGGGKTKKITKNNYGGGKVYVGRNFGMPKGRYEYDEDNDCFILRTKKQYND